MSTTHQATHHIPAEGEEFGTLGRDLASLVAHGVDSARPAPAQRQAAPQVRPVAPPPGGSAGPGPGSKVGPLTPARQPSPEVKPAFTKYQHRDRLASPFEQLVEVVEDAYRLRQEVEQMIAALTGEEPVQVRRMQPMGPVCGLLPNVSRLAAEIGAVHGQISDRVLQIRERLG